ncbi:MAG: potassium channel family protein [Acidobacteriota bacterium]
MIPSLVWGMALTLVSVAVHIVGLLHLGQLLSLLIPTRLVSENPLQRTLFLSLAVLLMILLHLLGAALWAAAYCWIGELDDFPTALYFSVVTATSLGYGDITLSPPWQLLAVFEAMTGLLLFGASTAAVFRLMVKVMPDPLESKLEPDRQREADDSS